MRRAPPVHRQVTSAPPVSCYSTSPASSHAPAHPQPSVPVSPLARQVYKRLMWAARDYPGGPDKIRIQAKAAIRKHQHEHDADKIKELMVRTRADRFGATHQVDLT